MSTNQSGSLPGLDEGDAEAKVPAPSPSYIIAVNASIVSDSGGTCVCNNPRDGPDPWCEADTDYLLCKAEIKKDLITATAAISALGTFCMGLFANL